MNDEQKEAVKQMIARELAGVTKGAQALAGTPPQALSGAAQAPQIKQEPFYPSEVPLDEYEALMVEALGWRVEAAEKTNALLNSERNHITQMKNTLLQRCVNRLKIDVSKYNLLIDSGTKTIKIEKRG